MAVRHTLSRLGELLFDPGALRAYLSWPYFSLTSFRTLTALNRQGLQFRTLIDVGANVGQFAVAAAKIFPGTRIHCFEPHPACVEQLRVNVRGLGVTIYPLALAETEAQAVLRLNSNRVSSSLLPLGALHRDAFPTAREIAQVGVRQSTLDRIFEAQTLTPPVLLKLDVQGCEARTLAGGSRTLTRIDHVLLETSFSPLYEGEAAFVEILELMRQFGFRFCRPIDWLLNPRTGAMLQIDALFARVAG